MIPEWYHNGPYKREAEGGYTHKRCVYDHSGRAWCHAAQVKECWQSPEAGIGKEKILP